MGLQANTSTTQNAHLTWMEANNLNANLILDSEGQVEDYFNASNPFHKMNLLSGSQAREDFGHYLSQDYLRARAS